MSKELQEFKAALKEEAAEIARDAIDVELHGVITECAISLWHPIDKVQIRINKLGFKLMDREGETIIFRPMTKTLFNAIWEALR